MKRTILRILTITFLLTISFNYPYAQHFVHLTDKAKIESGLNLIRKGIQEMDTTMVLNACFPDLDVKGNTLS